MTHVAPVFGLIVIVTVLVVLLDLFVKTVGTAVLKGLVCGAVTLLFTPIAFLAISAGRGPLFCLIYFSILFFSILGFVQAVKRYKAKKATPR
jgi:hypothetical protein